jgi:hypothetical protein
VGGVGLVRSAVLVVPSGDLGDQAAQREQQREAGEPFVAARAGAFWE